MILYKPQFSIEIKMRRPVGRVRGAARNRPNLFTKVYCYCGAASRCKEWNQKMVLVEVK